MTQTLEQLRSQSASFGNEPLLTLPNGEVLNLANGYIPLLTNFTHEDKAAKGLRKRKAGQQPETPIYFSALELVSDNAILFLTGASGSGKTTFAKHLSFALATTGLDKPSPLIRNELGDIHDEIWGGGKLLPSYFATSGLESLRTLTEHTLPRLLDHMNHDGDGVLIILDDIEAAGNEGPELLSRLCHLVPQGVKFLVLGDADTCARWVLPSNVARHELSPLLKAQRRQTVSQLLGTDSEWTEVATGDAASNPALFALSLQAGHPGRLAEEVLDGWLSTITPGEESANALAAKAYESLSGKQFLAISNDLASQVPSSVSLLSCGVIQNLLAARHLVNLPVDNTVNLFHKEPDRSKSVVRSCLIRLGTSEKSNSLIQRLLTSSPADSQRAALLIADLVPAASEAEERIAKLVLKVVEEGLLSPGDRERAGRVLSRLGDPRDLTALAEIPAGNFIMGSDNHPNSQPTNSIALGRFRIGIYPVVNKDYLAFTRQTGRDWFSVDGADPERLNAPATDLTWHDARAYCSWLTVRWRKKGKISSTEHVRLPTEPEWERASRGDQDGADGDGQVYPWGSNWRGDATNSEETGFNNTCAVGLFPKGRSPYGCYDMAGQVWEWCTTLWGKDMANPQFRYPWKHDDREIIGAAGEIRRVLRGGCFSSPQVKANCTYRGSLEPAGFWRGNGFRVVVAAEPS